MEKQTEVVVEQKSRQRRDEYFVKNERTNIVTIVTKSEEVRIEPFATVKVTKAVAESAHTLELVSAGVVTLSTQ